MKKEIKRTFYRDAYNDNKVWEVAELSGGHYLRQYINGQQFGRGLRTTKKHIQEIGIFDFEKVQDETGAAMEGKETTQAENLAVKMIANPDTERLLEQWELTEKINDPHIPTVRGWLMDELEKRNPEGFEKWLDGEALDGELRTYF